MTTAVNLRAPSPDDDSLLLTELLARLGVANWDVLISGDGSGNSYDNPSGWAGILIDRITRGRRLFFGAINSGSINLAEALPYMQAISWFDEKFGKDRLKTCHNINVIIITDSQVVRRWLEISTQELHQPLPRQHISIWAAMRAWRQIGYNFSVHWTERKTHGFNVMSDLLAGLSRRSVMDVAAGGDLVRRAREALNLVTFSSDIYAIHPL